jgi:DNA sulfur modification protein DndB
MNSGSITKIYGHHFIQFGKEVLVTQMPFKLLLNIFEVDPYVQRKLDPGRRNSIRDFILHTVKEGSFYFSPFVFSARGHLQKVGEHWEVKSGAKIAILDGQHRCRAMESAIRHLSSMKEALEDIPTTPQEELDLLEKQIQTLNQYPITMHIFLDLNTLEERQLFTDINTERSNAHNGLIVLYDQRDPYTQLTKKVANQLENYFEIEMRLSRLTMQNTALTSLVMMRKCLVALFEGNISHKEGAPNFRYCKEEEAEAIALRFFKSWANIFPKGAANRTKFVCGLTGVQKALAFAVYKLVSEQGYRYEEAIDLVEKLKNITTWRHDDELFKEFYDSKTKRLTNHSTNTVFLKLTDQLLNVLQGVGKQ